MNATATSRKISKAPKAAAGWGGWRPGAGRKPKGERPGVAHVRRAQVRPNQPMRVLLQLLPGLGDLSRAKERDVIRACCEAAHDTKGFEVLGWGTEASSLVLKVRAQNRRALSRGMQGLGIRVARGLNRMWENDGRVFADRYEDREEVIEHLLKRPAKRKRA